MLKTTAVLHSLLLLTSQLTHPAVSQTSNPNGCLRLSGSTACPGFSSAWVHPANLSNAFPFFEDVDSVASFDAGVFRYLSDPDQYRQTKFVEQLGCTNSSLTMLRYARTMLCSSWVNSRWSIECFDLYGKFQLGTTPLAIRFDLITMHLDGRQLDDRHGDQDDLSRLLLCHVKGRTTDCLKRAMSVPVPFQCFAVHNACPSSRQQADCRTLHVLECLIDCPGPDLTGGARDRNITKDFVQCTNWSVSTSQSFHVILTLAIIDQGTHRPSRIASPDSGHEQHRHLRRRRYKRRELRVWTFDGSALCFLQLVGSGKLLLLG